MPLYIESMITATKLNKFADTVTDRTIDALEEVLDAAKTQFDRQFDFSKSLVGKLPGRAETMVRDTIHTVSGFAPVTRREVEALQARVAADEVAVKKLTASGKKPVAKKAVAKKRVAKKAVAKKRVAKKAVAKKSA